MIYLIKAGDCVKIGYARNEYTVSSILKDFQAKHFLDLEVTRVIEGGFNDCDKFKSHFSNQFIKNDWFKYDPEMISFTIQSEPKPLKQKEKKLKDLLIGESLEYAMAEKGFLARSYAAPYWLVEKNNDKIKFTRLK